MGDLVYLEVDTTLDVPVDRVLDMAKANLKLDDVAIVIGYNKDGDMYFASSTSSAPSVNWLLDKAKHRLQELTEEES